MSPAAMTTGSAAEAGVAPTTAPAISNASAMMAR
jgi:hypothetical protein